MSLDDRPIEALRKHFAVEDSSTSPVTEAVLRFVASTPLPWPLNAGVERIRDRINADATHRIKIMLETCADEILRHEEKLRSLQEELTAAQSDAKAHRSRELLLDAARKASATRGIDRVRRIGTILAHGVVDGREDNDDETEEMMRIATELFDSDVEYLRNLVKIHGEQVERAGRIERYQAYVAWENGPWRNSPNPAIDSAFSKLESYGLVSRIPPPNNLNLTADIQSRYALLPKGLRFIELVKRKISS